MRSKDGNYIGPETGHEYLPGERIKPELEGIGATGEKSSPHAFMRGREMYKRIFIRLRTPQETLTCRPIRDGKDFADRAAIIESWFHSVVRTGNFMLTFEAQQITDEEADEIEKGGEV